jgi:hypothetical protein
MEDSLRERGLWSGGAWLIRMGLMPADAYADAYAYAYAYANANAYALPYPRACVAGAEAVGGRLPEAERVGVKFCRAGMGLARVGWCRTAFLVAVATLVGSSFLGRR